MESDCLKAVEMVNKEFEGCNDLDPLVQNIKWRRTVSNCKAIQFIYREANRVAHLLAKSTMKIGQRACETRDIPLEALSVIEEEKPDLVL